MSCLALSLIRRVIYLAFHLCPPNHPCLRRSASSSPTSALTTAIPS